MSKILQLLTAACLTISCGAAKTAGDEPPDPDMISSSTDPGFSGVFARSEPSLASLQTDEVEPGRWAMVLVAGGLPREGATAADCAVKGAGVIVDGELVFDTRPLDQDDSGDDSQTARIIVVVNGDVATVKDQGTAWRFCSLGSDLAGRYHRQREQ